MSTFSLCSPLVPHLAKVSSSLEQNFFLWFKCSAKTGNMGISLWTETLAHVFYLHGREIPALWVQTNRLGFIALLSNKVQSLHVILYYCGQMGGLAPSILVTWESFTPIHHWALKNWVIIGKMSNLFSPPPFQIKQHVKVHYHTIQQLC